MPSESIRGTAILCDKRGTIIDCLKDDLGISSNFPSGKLLGSCFSTDQFHKALEFSIHLKSSKSTFNWEMSPGSGDKRLIFNFGGGSFNDHLLIVATETQNSSEILFNEIAGLNSATGADLPLKDNILKLNTRENAWLMIDELTHLNNEIINYKEEISRKNKELEELSATKNQFLGMAAHDLRNPLGNIKSYSEFLLDDKENLTEEQIEYIQSINSLSQFMVGLVNDLLDITNIESGKFKLEMRNVILRQLIEKNIRFIHLLAEKKDIKIIFTPYKNPIQITLDQRKINQVLTNLLSNAVKYSFPGKNIYISTAMNNGDAVISIKDEGQGIPAEELPNLFKPFHKFSVKSTDGETSTGLGLVIVRKIVEAHNGRITVESKIGIGSNFTFTLPIKGISN